MAEASKIKEVVVQWLWEEFTQAASTHDKQLPFIEKVADLIISKDTTQFISDRADTVKEVLEAEKAALAKQKLDREKQLTDMIAIADGAKTELEQ